MTKTFAKALIAAGLLAGAAGAARADDDRPGRDWMPIEQVVRTLTDAGYADVRGIEADDGMWEGKATRDGRAVKVKVDPHSGAVTEKAAKAGKSDREKRDRDDD